MSIFKEWAEEYGARNCDWDSNCSFDNPQCAYAVAYTQPFRPNKYALPLLPWETIVLQKEYFMHFGPRMESYAMWTK